MRVGISAFGSQRLFPYAKVVRDALTRLENDATLVSDSPYSLNFYDFLIFITEPKGIVGGLLPSLPQKLAKQEGLMGKRCLAMVRKKGLRSGYTLRKFMGALEHEGLVVVEGELFSDAKTAERIAQNAPLSRG